jgi:membrane protein YqaA with SNARE-associated domain
MTIWEALGAVAGSLAVSFGTSFLPIGGGVEVYLVATSALLPTAFVAPLVLACAAGCVAAKTILFVGAGRAASHPSFLGEGGKRAAFAARIKDGPWARRAILLLSSTLSVPPYYAIALAAGALKTPRSEFVVVTFVGQSIRFAGVWAIARMGLGLVGS